jgi:hypothetical protein
MKILILVLAFGMVSFVSPGIRSDVLHARETDEHSDWIAQSLKEIERVKVGMTRADLLKVFNEEGGISTRTQRRYVYRECPYIKVDVEFEPVGELDNKSVQSPQDKIAKISKPFLEWSIID